MSEESENEIRLSRKNDLEQEVEKHFQDGLNLVHTLMRVQLKTKFTLEELVEKSKDCLN